MKLPISFFLVTTFSFLSAQTLDLSFGEEGVYKMHGSIDRVIEVKEGVFITNGSGLKALDYNGNVQKDFGDDGSISNPFLGSFDLVTNVQYIDNGVDYLDNRISLIGCSKDAETNGIDLFVQHYNSRSGNCIEDLNFTDTLPGDQEFTAAVLKDDLFLFGYSELPDELVSPNEHPISFFSTTLNVDDYTITPRLPFSFPLDGYLAVPYHFKGLSDNRTLVIYEDFWARNFFEVVSSIKDVGNADHVFHLRDDIDLSKCAIEINDQTILTATRRKDFLGPQVDDYAITVDMSLIDINDGSLEDLGLTIFPENYFIESINEIHEKYFISGYILDETTEFENVVLYSLNKDFTLNDDFGDDGVMEIETYSDRLNRVRVDHVGENIYLSISGTRGVAEVFRFNSELSNTTDVETDKDFVISPNPASDVIYLEENEELGEVEYSIYSALGKRLITTSMSAETGINIS